MRLSYSLSVYAEATSKLKSGLGGLIFGVVFGGALFYFGFKYLEERCSSTPTKSAPPEGISPDCVELEGDPHWPGPPPAKYALRLVFVWTVPNQCPIHVDVVDDRRTEEVGARIRPLVE